MTQSQALIALLCAIFIGLVAIWRELRVGNRNLRAKNRTERVVLPLSTSAKLVVPNQSVEITARADRHFKPERLFISDGFGGAADWIVNDIRIGGQSVFAQSGDIPGDMFASSAVDSFLSFPIAEPGQAVSMIATYIGIETEGRPLYANMIGTRVLKREPRAKRREKELVTSASN
jgi:hypothetical protein